MTYEQSILEALKKSKIYGFDPSKFTYEDVDSISLDSQLKKQFNLSSSDDFELTLIFPFYNFDNHLSERSIICKNDTEVIAILGYDVDGETGKIPYISVRKDYRGYGISKVLIDMAFKTFAENEVKIIQMTPFSVQGQARMEHTFKKYEDLYGMKIEYGAI